MSDQPPSHAAVTTTEIVYVSVPPPAPYIVTDLVIRPSNDEWIRGDR